MLVALMPQKKKKNKKKTRKDNGGRGQSRQSDNSLEEQSKKLGFNAHTVWNRQETTIAK